MLWDPGQPCSLWHPLQVLVGEPWAEGNTSTATCRTPLVCLLSLLLSQPLFSDVLWAVFEKKPPGTPSGPFPPAPLGGQDGRLPPGCLSSYEGVVR